MVLLSGPNLGGNELKYVKECIDTEWVSSVGSYVTQFEEMLAEKAGSKFAIATSSGTTALHTCLHILGVNRDDYVIVPNVTFIASLNSIKYTGADPILMDVDSDTWQMNLDLLEQFFSEECYTKDSSLFYKKDDRRIPVIMPVHVLGNMCDMERLVSLCDKYHVTIVEDSTEALGSTFNSKHSGSFGLMGCFSFNGNKLITTGGGGMIVTDDEALAKRAKHVTTQAKSDRMEYIHDEIGFNYRLTNVAAAMGVGQMEQLEDFLNAKQKMKDYYMSNLSGVGDIRFQKVEKGIDPNWWLFTIRTSKMRNLLGVLNSEKLQARPFWVPMNKLEMFKNNIYYNHKDVSATIYGECISIPCSTNITEEQMNRVINVIKSQF
jgi:Predicted pyridoxal phosphate-dependent enzyme apparently involved in regulation of cell wall biogenesis